MPVHNAVQAQAAHVFAGSAGVFFPRKTNGQISPFATQRIDLPDVHLVHQVIFQQIIGDIAHLLKNFFAVFLRPGLIKNGIGRVISKAQKVMRVWPDLPLSCGARPVRRIPFRDRGTPSKAGWTNEGSCANFQSSPYAALWFLVFYAGYFPVPVAPGKDRLCR